MITDFLISMFLDFLGFLSSLLPTSWIPTLLPFDITFLKYIFIFISPTFFTVIFNTFVTVTGIQFGWAIIEWSYKKIPGVD